MKYLKTLPIFLLISLLFFSCVEHDKNSNQKVNAITGVFTRKQVESGSLLYTNNCGACHGKDLRGSEGGNALIGERFITKWKEKSLSELFELTKATMPKNNPHSLDDASYSSLLAFILNANEFPPGNVDLPTAKKDLENRLEAFYQAAFNPLKVVSSVYDERNMRLADINKAILDGK